MLHPGIAAHPLSVAGSAEAEGVFPVCGPPQVSVDIFKGFPDEDSIVNYTLNQAYQDNVSVFASEYLLDNHGVDLLFGESGG